uniref:Zinc knuckle domain-like n=1 Tax=Oryza sativa subsp. japonica TaxID=39947 RepID=Q5Z5Q6_ORYSJ|nr:zinc knuckle domain-like [Oryza sativa Japonica Group]
MEPRSPRPIPPSPAALSLSRRYIIVPRASLLRFRHSPLALPVGFVLAPSSSLSAVAAELRFAAVVAPDFLPTRRHLHRLRRVVVGLVRSSVSPADRRSTVVLAVPNRAAAFLHSGRRFRRPRRPGTLQLRKIRSSWKLKPTFGKASKSKRSFGEEVLGGVLAYTPVERL